MQLQVVLYIYIYMSNLKASSIIKLDSILPSSTIDIATASGGMVMYKIMLLS